MYGVHLLFDGYKCSRQKLSDEEHIKQFLKQIVEVIEMTRLTEPFVLMYPSPQSPEDWGYSGFVIVAESHVSIHTYPDKGFVTIDVYSCKDFDVKKAEEFIVQSFDVGEWESQSVRRGLKFPKTKIGN